MHIFSFHFLEKRFVLDPPIPPPPSHPLARRHARAAQASSALPPPLLHRMNRDIDAHAARRAYTFLYVRQSIVHTFRFPSLVERAHIPRESISACFSAPSHPSFPSSTISYSSFSVPLASCLAHRTSRLAPPRSATRQLINSLAHCPPPPPFPHLLSRSLQFSLPPSLPPQPPPFPLPSAPLVRPGPSPLCPPPFLPTRGGYPSSPGRNPLPLSISAAPSSTSIPLLHRASSTRHPSLINVI